MTSTIWPSWRSGLGPDAPPVSSQALATARIALTSVGWGDVFGDQAVAAAMIDHHADVLTLKGSSYRLRGRGIDSLPSIRNTTSQTGS